MSDITAAHKGIGVFFGPEGKLTQKAEGPESIRGAVEAAEREVGAATIPALYLLLLLGGLVGSFVKPRALSVKSLLASAAVLSFCQFWYHCPTCPQVEIFGVPLGLLGAIIYSAAALPRITERYSIWIGIMSSAGCVLQVLLVQAYDTTCLWCAFIGGINSFLAVVCLLTRVQTQPIVSRRSSTFVGASLFAALAIAVGAKNFMRTPGKQNSFVQPAPTLVGLNLADLHLTAQKSEEVVMFIADGCQPCHDALSVLQRSGVNPRYVFCGQVPAGYIGKAERVDGNTIRTTPTFAFVGPTGLISAERVGWPEDQERQSELLSMVSAVAKRGSSQSHKNALGRLQ